MDTDQRVLAFHVPRACFWVVAIQIGMGRPVNGRLSVNDLAECRRQLLIRCISAGPESVTADGGHSIIVKMCHACWLSLVDQVCMPAGVSSRLTEIGWVFGCLKRRPDDSDAAHARHLGDLRLKWIQ